MTRADGSQPRDAPTLQSSEPQPDLTTTTADNPNRWQGCRVTVMGLGRHGGGLGAAQWLDRQGALVTVTDLASRERLQESIAQLSPLVQQRAIFGQHRVEDFLQAHAVVVNPAVRPDNRLLHLARQRGVRLTSEIELFLERCPARVIGVTGSNGKSTTATLLAGMLESGGLRTWLGGNLGGSLLLQLDQIKADDWVVLELSSFQLALLADEGCWPHFAVVTNCSPNHLDWHGSWQAYVAAKRRILTQLPAAGLAVLNPDDPETAHWQSFAAGRVLWAQLPPMLQVPASWGRHGRQNAALAATCAQAIGMDDAALQRAIDCFQPLPYRQANRGLRDGRLVINDSKSTTVAATQAALEAVGPNVWLLLGGQDKGSHLPPLWAAARGQLRGLALFGSCRLAWQESFRWSGLNVPSLTTEHLADAVRWCAEQSQPGDVILLSPGCASLDQFADYCQRGQTFDQLIDSLWPCRNDPIRLAT